MTDLDAGEGNDQADRVLDAAQVLVARWGVTKTSLSDVAGEAGMSRATLYRVFPGGKRQVFLALAYREMTAYAKAVAEAIDSGYDLTDAITRGLVVAARLLRDHEAARFVLDHEPELFTPIFGFRSIDVVYAGATDRLAPHLERFLPPERARWVVEWTCRVFLSYVVAKPDPAADLGDVAFTRNLVSTYMTPAFVADSPAHRRDADPADLAVTVH